MPYAKGLYTQKSIFYHAKASTYLQRVPITIARIFLQRREGEIKVTSDLFKDYQYWFFVFIVCGWFMYSESMMIEQFRYIADGPPVMFLSVVEPIS